MAENFTKSDLILTKFILGTNWETLPADVQERALICFMDNLGAGLVGTRVKSTGIAADCAIELFPGEQATLLCTGRRVSMLGAAFANGVAANAIDIDDSGAFTWGHPGAQILPAALSICESKHASGADMLAATVVGYEVMFRTGRCWYDRDPLLRGCGSWGSLGCAALAANILKLSPAQTMNALGIADYHSPSLPLMRDVDEPAMVKHGIGLGPMTGLMSAELAARGFTGITSLLSDEKYQDWVGDIGTHFILPKGISWKDYACCAWSHPALIGFKRLMAEHNFSAEQISRIIVEVYEEASHLGVNLPDTTEQAQFNLAWPIAALMVDGEVGPNQVLEKRLTDEQIRAIARKVEISVSAELTHFYELSERMDPEGVDASRVILELNDGRKLESGLAVTPPYVEQNWDRSRMERKFRWLLAEIIPKPVVDKLVEMVWGFDQVQDVGELSEIISKLKLFPH